MFHYFGYGSNLSLASLRAKGVEPHSSVRGTLAGWQLVFDVRHWYRHEGGVGNIRRCDDTHACVEGLVHLCDDHHLALLDAMESYGVGYDRIEVDVDTQLGPVRAFTYVGLPAHLDPACLPTQRYLNIVLQGALAAGLSPDYIERLRRQPVLAPKDYPPFEHPDEPFPCFDSDTLARHPHYTAIAGAVFDMTHARPELHCVKELFGGKDITLFHLRRLDTSDGREGLHDFTQGRLSEAAQRYLNAYLHEFHLEYRYVGRYSYDDPTTAKEPQ
jgi:hypothetical protein